MYKKTTKGQQIVFKPRRMVIGGVVYNVDNEETLNKIKVEMANKKEEQKRVEEEAKNKKILIKRTISNSKNDIITKTIIDPDTIVSKEEKKFNENKNSKYIDHIKKPTLSVKTNSAIQNNNNNVDANQGPITIKTHAHKMIKKPTGKTILNDVKNEDDGNEVIDGNNDGTPNEDIKLDKPISIQNNERKLIIRPQKSGGGAKQSPSADNSIDNYFTKKYPVLSEQWYELVMKVKHNNPINGVKLLIKIVDENKNPIIHPIKIANDLFLNGKFPNGLYEYKVYVYIPANVENIDIYIVGLKIHNINLSPVDSHIVETNIDLWKFRKLNDLDCIMYYIKNAKLECSEKFLDRFNAEYELYKNPDYFTNFTNNLTIPKTSNKVFKYNSKTKILYLIHSSIEYEEYGYTLRTQQLLENFNNTSDKYKVICSTRYAYPFDREVGYYSKEPTKKVKINDLKYIKPFTDKGQNFNTLNILKYLEKYIIDIINICVDKNIKIIHATTNYWNGIVSSCVANYLGIKCIYELRELWNESIMLQKPEVLHSDIAKMISNQEKNIMANSDKIIVLNDTQNLQNGKIETLYDCTYITDLDMDIRNDLMTKYNLDGKFIIGFVGSLTVYQNIEHILKCIKLLDDDNVMFIIIGDGPHKSSIIDYVKSNGLNDKVLCLGKLSYDEAINYYNVFDVCVYPRKKCELYELKSSYKVIEAMSHGKPVIATNLKAMSEIITDNENGLLCKPDDINDLLEKIKMVKDDTDLRIMMGNNALDYIKNNDMDINSVCVKLSSIYDGLLSDVCNDYGDVMSEAIVHSESDNE